MLTLYRIIGLALSVIISVTCFAKSSEESEQTNTQIVISEIITLQHSIDKDFSRFKGLNGELESLVEYQIYSKIEQITKSIDNLIRHSEVKDWQLAPILHEQIEFAHEMNNYLNQKEIELEKKVNNNNNFPILLEISRLNKEKNNYLKLQLKVINWSEKIGIDIEQEKSRLIVKLFEIADNYQSLVNFIESQLKEAISEVDASNKEISQQQTLRIINLRQWLKTSIAAFDDVISLLDDLNQNTAELKKTAFAISGDITQDVLNIDVVSELLRQWLESSKTFFVESGPNLVFKILIFILILSLTFIIARVVESIVKNAVKNSKLKLSRLLQDFFIKLSGKVVFILGMLIGLSQLGFQLGPLLAGFGIAGVIIGFALQDTLSNFASGMMILIYRPFDVGDTINAAGIKGKVARMNLVSTTILTFDNQRLLVPNNKIWGDIINNITGEKERRVDMVFGIGYHCDIEHAEKVLMKIITQHPKVLKTPEPVVRISALSDSSVDINVRPWATPEDYWDVYWDVTREVKIQFDKEGISIPFPQRDIHIYQHDKV